MKEDLNTAINAINDLIIDVALKQLMQQLREVEIALEHLRDASGLRRVYWKWKCSRAVRKADKTTDILNKFYETQKEN